MNQHHLAQINIARAQASMDSQLMKGFVDRLEDINSLADNSPGFVWRLQSDGGDATAIRVFDDPMMLINMSVWENMESLRHFVYKSLHVELISDRDTWFDKIVEMHMTLWWIPAGHIPSIEEGKEKLELLRANGPGKAAFTFARSFEPEG